MFNNHLMKACLAAVFAIGLAACSSSSDTATETTPPDPGPTQEEQQLADLQQEIADLRAQLGITDADDIGDTITALMGERDRLQGQLDDAADAAADAMRAAEIVAAAKLYAGISLPTADDADTADTDTATGTRFAQHATGDNAGAIEVAISNDPNVFLTEDKDATVADNAGWEGKRYTRMMPAADGTYEAVVYSNVEASTAGKKFGHAGTANDDFEYQLTNGGLTVDTTSADNAARVSGSSFDHSAGVKTFELPTNTVAVMIPGNYHGVSGTWSCTPGGNTCAARVAAEGFELGTVDDQNAFTGSATAWVFSPTNPNAPVMSAPDTSYASYGWWIHKAANDGAFTASAFVDELGAESPAAEGLDALNGTASYVGGAAGQYALSSSTGGTNDSGHFTARARLEANFNGTATTANAITGTIDMFTGADGQSRNWEVELAGSTISDAGVIGAATDGTTWTIDGTDAAAAGMWTGSLRNNGDDLVPQVATGTFYSTYGTAGRMIGAFGANKQ